MQELWILVISRMAHLICYEILMGPIRFVVARGPWAICIVCLSRPCKYIYSQSSISQH